jgi:hypothetical protein
LLANLPMNLPTFFNKFLLANLSTNSLDFVQYFICRQQKVRSKPSWVRRKKF